MSNLKERTKNIPVLTKEEEKELFVRLGNGDTSVIDVLMKHNLRLVASIALKYTTNTTSFEVDDLISEGVIGLKTAILKFDHTRNNKFSTYSTFWIRQSMTRAILNKSKIVRIPVHMEEKISKKRKAGKYAVDVNDIIDVEVVSLDYTAEYRGLAHGELVANLEAWNGEDDPKIASLEAKVDRGNLLTAIADIKVISTKERRAFYYSVVGESVKRIAKRFKTTPAKIRRSIERVANTVRSTISCQDYL